MPPMGGPGGGPGGPGGGPGGPGGFGGGFGGGPFGPFWGSRHSDSSYHGGSSNSNEEYDDFAQFGAGKIEINYNIVEAKRFLHNKRNNYALYKSMDALKKEGKDTTIRFGTKVGGFFLGVGRTFVNPFSKLRYSLSCQFASNSKKYRLDELPYEVSTQEEYNARKAEIEKDYGVKMFNNHERRLRRAYRFGYISGKEYNEQVAKYIEQYKLTDGDLVR